MQTLIQKKRPPGPLLFLDQPHLSLTKEELSVQVVALSVSDSFFINPLGPAVVWTPAVPGQLHNCEARGDVSATARVFAHCQHNSNRHGLASARSTATASVRLDAGEPSLMEKIIGIPTDNSPVQVRSSVEISSVPMVHLHVHIPPEAFSIAVLLQEVCCLHQCTMRLPMNCYVLIVRYWNV